MNWETYTAFGDSITLGARTYLGYPERVGDKLSSHLQNQWNVINHAVCGFKAIDLARDIDKYFLELKGKQPSISSILVGTNDVKEHTEPREFGIALNQVILKARLLTVNGNVVIIPIPHFHKGVAYPYSFEMNETVTVYNAEICQLALRHGIRVIDISHAREDFSDGVHLNAKGTETFANQIANYILKDKGIELQQAVNDDVRKRFQYA